MSENVRDDTSLKRTQSVLRLLDQKAWLVLLVAMLAVAMLILYLGRDTTFFYDEWSFVQERRPWNFDAILTPHNEHLYLLAVVIYKAFFELFGLQNYIPYQLAAIALHLLCVGLLFEVIRRRAGNLIALFVSLSLLTLGSAWQDILWPFQLGFFGSIAFGLTMILMLDRRTRRGEIGACVFLLLSIASSSFGFIIAIFAAVTILWKADRWRRIWILIVPLVIYGFWYSSYGTSAVKSGNIGLAPLHMAEQASAALAGIFGLTLEYGRSLLIGFVALTLVVLVRSSRRFGPKLTGALIALVGYLALTAFVRADLNEPGASRYVYLGALLIFLLVSELWVMRFRVGGLARLTSNWSQITRQQCIAVVGVALLALFAITANLDQLRKAGITQREISTSLKAELAIVQGTAARLPDDFQPDPRRAPQIYFAAYRDAVNKYGSPAATESEIVSGGRITQQAADDELSRVYSLVLSPEPTSKLEVSKKSSSSSKLVVTASSGGALLRRDSCIRKDVSRSPDAALELGVQNGGVLIRAEPEDVTVYVRRYRRNYVDVHPIGLVKAGTLATLNLPRDGLREPWHVRLVGKGELVCPL